MSNVSYAVHQRYYVNALARIGEITDARIQLPQFPTLIARTDFFRRVRRVCFTNVSLRKSVRYIYRY